MQDPDPRSRTAVVRPPQAAAAGAAGRAGRRPARTAVLRPPEAAAAPGPAPRRPARVLAAALLSACLAAVAAVAVAAALLGGSQDGGASPSLRPASPEEVAAVTGSQSAAAAEGAAGEQPAAGLLGAGGSPVAEQPAVEGSAPDGRAASAAAAGDPAAASEYPAPAVSDEPVVAVAEALSPSVVLVEVDAQIGFGLGSGIVWDADDGYIVTNQHVVEGAESVTVHLSDGTRLDGEVVGGSSGHDVAVVRVDPGAAGLVAATFAPVSSVRVGQLAVAIGSPLGLTGTVTAGIVSAVRIQVQGGADPSSPVPVEMIQTDAAINRGNSGGALADWQGRVIGMNTMIQTTTGGSIGLGFAVPSDTVDLIATRIINGESLELGYLGISGQASEGDDVGVLVAEVLPGSPAAEAGLEAGDVIVSLGGEPMHDITELSAAIKLRRPGEPVELTIKRGGDLFVATAVLDALG
ncbi:MAG: trypsin-like peptidase domain-containing protein [Acidimicrobiaceae bacterium]|nr:trypsin-like peptidase domain-containing protein [Acidimicrobiaceae bacterium]